MLFNQLFAKNKVLIGSVIIVSSVLSTLLFLDTEKTDAIFYGTPTDKFEESGYMIADLGSDYIGLCGINFISSNTAITAAHCLTDAMQVYLNTGTAKSDYISDAPQVDYFQTSPNYSDYAMSLYPGASDVGVVVLEDSVPLTSYGGITSPKPGCDYYLVGYGKDEFGESFNRNGTDVCIENITEETFELTFSNNSHFCVGDSGSGIYEKNTNNIVGIVSSFITPLNTTGCENALAFIATRLDANQSFIDQHMSASNTPTPTSAQLPTATPTLAPIETVPNDYLKDYYPEAANPDGSFDLDNEILFKVKELDALFGAIYPDDDTTGTPPSPTDSYENTPTPTPESTGVPFNLNDNLTPTAPIVSIAPQSKDGSPILGWLIALSVGGLLVVIIATLLLTVLKKKYPVKIDPLHDEPTSLTPNDSRETPKPTVDGEPFRT